MQLHPATKILLWIVLAFITQLLQTASLLVLSALLLLLVVSTQGHDFLGLIRRTRWLLISLFFIYGFATPGEVIYPALGIFSPSIQGVQSGALQAWRLIVLLAGLATLFATTTRDGLLSGVYLMLRPLNMIGINPDRITLRIGLTLHYAEQVSQLKLGKEWKNLSRGVERLPTMGGEMSLEITPFRWYDLLSVLLIGLVMVGLLLL